VIEFENAGFGYGRTTILAETSLTLQPGTFHVLLGPSGSGKSTFLRLCYMDLVPSSGRIRFFGRAIRPRDRNGIADLRRVVGVLPQDPRFLDHLTLVENIALPLQVSGIDMHRRAEDLEALLEWVDLTDRVSALPAALSASERQRAALARAVILSPEVILADEPTGSLDREMGARLLTLLVELNRMGKTVVIATHDPELAEAAAAAGGARVLHVADGRVTPDRADH
jgi:cell division transport system ATP-binding protein